MLKYFMCHRPLDWLEADIIPVPVLNKFLIKLDTNKQLLLTFFAKTSMNVC